MASKYTLTNTAEKEITLSFERSDDAEPLPPADIVSFNELRSCADLYRLYATSKLEIQPDFQRDVVWKEDERTRFIDSLVKQLPIPSMCFSLDYKTQKWKVIDGLQRMSSIISFLGDKPWKLRNLEDIHPILRGAINHELEDGPGEAPRLYSTVLDVSIPITVLRCDYSQASHMQYLYTIFHRLNSGGVRLNNQEIRNCIYTGSFNSALKDFDATNKDWAFIKKIMWGSSKRFRSIELLLRALAFSETFRAYDGNLARFLNNYMHNNMDSDDRRIDDILHVLSIMSYAASAALRHTQSKVSMTIIEAVLVGILVNSDVIPTYTEHQLYTCLETMLNLEQFQNSARYAIASERNVTARIEAAIEAFSVPRDAIV